MNRKIRFGLLIGLSLIVLACAAWAQMTFFLVDNFEDGNYTQNPEWYTFGNVKAEVVKNQFQSSKDVVAQTAGNSILLIKGETKDWYVGGIGTSLNIDATDFSRVQFDVFGSDAGGTLKVELYQDDDYSGGIELDSNKNWEPIADSRWVAEINLLGPGFTRYSIPFSAFRHDNPGVGADKWNPTKKGNAGGLMKIQFVAIGKSKESKVDFALDNIILTY